MAKLETKCVVCKRTFETNHWRIQKTCSKPCLLEHRRCQMLGNKLAVGHAPNATSFGSGHTPWNKGVSVRMSPATEFKKGMTPKNKLPVGSVTIRVDKKGNPRAWIKINEKTWRTRAAVVWCEHFGDIPDGCIVHHRDEDTLNDAIHNLQCVTRAEHMNEHRDKLTAAMRRAKARNRASSQPS